MKYTRVYATPDGESHMEDVNVEVTTVDYMPGHPPVDFSKPIGAAKGVSFYRLPPGWFADQHPTPNRQLIIVSSGKLETRTTDGRTLTAGPGDVFLVEDRTGKGHISRVVGDGEVWGAVAVFAD